MVSAQQLVLRPLKNALGAILGVVAYAKEVSGVSQLFVKDSGGTEYQLTGGALVTEYTADGPVSINGHASLDNDGAPLVMTLADPGAAGKRLVISQIDTGTQGHTVTTASAGGFDGTNNTATFDAQYETLVLESVAADRWVIVENVGSVGLSAV